MIRVVSWLCVHVASVSLDMHLINSGNVFASIVGGLAWFFPMLQVELHGCWVFVPALQVEFHGRLGVNLGTIRAD